MRYVTNAKGEQIVISRSGEVPITDDNAASASATRFPTGHLERDRGKAVRAGPSSLSRIR